MKMEENKMQTGQRKPAFGESRGIVKDYTVDKTTYRYRGTTDDDYTIYLVRAQCTAYPRGQEIDITNAAQHLFIDHPTPFHGKIWLVDCILEFGDDVPIGGKI